MILIKETKKKTSKFFVEKNFKQSIGKFAFGGNVVLFGKDYYLKQVYANQNNNAKL